MNSTPARSDLGASQEARFAAALFDPALEPPAVKSWNGSDPAQRFGVYRNNVIVALVNALADTFPAVQAMVGVHFFRAMARASLAVDLPETPVLAHFGQGFADFVAAFPPAASWPCLADLARLEFARVEAFHAADAPALEVADLAPLLGDPRLASLRLTWHPSLRLLPSPHPIVTLWAAHAAGEDQRQIDWTRGETALVLRQGLAVDLLALNGAEAAFLAALVSGRTLAEAAAASGREDFDFSPILGLLLRAGAVCGGRFATEETT